MLVLRNGLKNIIRRPIVISNQKSFQIWGYEADGYDENKHIWIEYDTLYHTVLNQKKKDLERENKIIRYFEDKRNLLTAFYRVLAYQNEEFITKYQISGS